MKKFFDEDFTLEEIKRSIKKLQKNEELNNRIITGLIVVSILAIVATVIVAIVKLAGKNNDDMFDEYDEDDDDDFYAQDEDFAE